MLRLRVAPQAGGSTVCAALSGSEGSRGDQAQHVALASLFATLMTTLTTPGAATFIRSSEFRLDATSRTAASSAAATVTDV